MAVCCCYSVKHWQNERLQFHVLDLSQWTQSVADEQENNFK